MIIKRQLVWLAVIAALLAAPLTASAKAQLPEFTALAAEAGKAVVNISSVKTVAASPMPFMGQRPPEGSPFRDFFDQFQKFFGERNMQPHEQKSLGSGFIISEDGYIVTNNHVIAEADEVTVLLQGEDDERPAEIVGRDPETDLALLKVDVDYPLHTLEFGDSDAVEVGQWVMAIGNPFGLGHTVTAGIISAKGRVIGSGPFDNFLQTDASINPGNSGGPLIDLDGKVIGINTAIIASGQGIGFAVPSTMARKIIAELRANKKISRGWLGVTIQNVDDNMAKALGLDKARGALVNSVVQGDPADKAGVRAGDVIIKVDGQDVDDTTDLIRRISNYKPGSKARLTVWRANAEKTLTVTLQERHMETAQAENGQEAPGEQPQELGLSLRPVRPEEAAQLGMDSAVGLLVTNIQPQTPADKAALQPGDVILTVNQKPVNNVSAFKSIVNGEGRKKGVVIMLVRRQGHNVFRTLLLDNGKN